MIDNKYDRKLFLYNERIQIMKKNTKIDFKICKRHKKRLRKNYDYPWYTFRHSFTIWCAVLLLRTHTRTPPPPPPQD